MDFVTFEIAKKLKEKGYPQNFSRRKSIKAASYHYYNFKGEIDGSVDDNRWYVSCPFIYQVLKWIREEKDIFIGLEYINQKRCGCNIIKQETGGLIAKWNWDKFQYANKNPLVGNTYEKAAIAGIEYVIDNLI